MGDAASWARDDWVRDHRGPRGPPHGSCRRCTAGPTRRPPRICTPKLRRRGQHTGLTTIYRRLHTLTEDGVPREFTVDGQAGYLACQPDPHDHLLCAVCGRVQSCALADRDTLTTTARNAGFTVDPPSISRHRVPAGAHRLR